MMSNVNLLAEIQHQLIESQAREAAAIAALEKLSGWLDRANYSPATEYTTHTHTYSPDERMAEDMRFQGDWQQADELVAAWQARNNPEDFK